MSLCTRLSWLQVPMNNKLKGVASILKVELSIYKKIVIKPIKNCCVN